MPQPVTAPATSDKTDALSLALLARATRRGQPKAPSVRLLARLAQSCAPSAEPKLCPAGFYMTRLPCRFFPSSVPGRHTCLRRSVALPLARVQALTPRVSAGVCV